MSTALMILGSVAGGYLLSVVERIVRSAIAERRVFAQVSAGIDERNRKHDEATANGHAVWPDGICNRCRKDCHLEGVYNMMCGGSVAAPVEREEVDLIGWVAMMIAAHGAVPASRASERGTPEADRLHALADVADSKAGVFNLSRAVNMPAMCGACSEGLVFCPYSPSCIERMWDHSE